MKTLIAGTFDNFHIGHQWLLWHGVAQSSHLTIIVARDITVEKIKKNTPKNTEHERLKRIQEEIKYISHVKVKLGRDDGNFEKTITEISPHKIILGYDQELPEKFIQKHKDSIIIERHTAFHPQFFKSSKF